ncbi:hypothetical protein PPMP20_14450 [Paraburkholderia phymatum]|uniref:hypothetical protein n=1 Tax=Paraburkholderia phymatum TaxID=148447 RepID=UPI0003068E82|nr:hypothetical protein [Paraburkholderia phymatum]
MLESGLAPDDIQEQQLDLAKARWKYMLVRLALMAARRVALHMQRFNAVLHMSVQPVPATLP